MKVFFASTNCSEVAVDLELGANIMPFCSNILYCTSIESAREFLKITSHGAVFGIPVTPQDKVLGPRHSFEETKSFCFAWESVSLHS